MPPRTDDSTIAGEVVLWRVMREATWIKETAQGVRQASHCFKDNTKDEGEERSEHETSVFIINEGISPAVLLNRVQPNVGYLCFITAQDARGEGFIVVRDAVGDVEGARHFVIKPQNADIRTAAYNKAAVKLALKGSLRDRQQL